MGPIVDIMQASEDNLLARRLFERGVHRKKPSLSFDKAGLLKCHREAAIESKAMQLRPSASRICDLVHPVHSSRHISTLSIISIREMEGLQLPHDFKNNILYGKLCVDALKTFGDSLQTVLEDESGRAVVVSIRNATVTTASMNEVADKFPEGLEVAIKSPHLKELWEDGCVGLRVDNPEDIVPRAALELELDVDDLKSAGYRFHSRNDWKTAAELYKKGIMALEHVTNRSREDETDLTLFYFRGAEALLQLGRPQEAFSYASIAMESYEGSHLLLVASLAALHRFDDAIAFLQGNEVSDKTRKIEELEVAKKQSRKGIYELDNYIGQAAPRNVYGPECDVENTPPILTEYVGPVEVRLGREPHNAERRGLFATQAVKAGELIFVNQAMAKGLSDPESVCFRDGDKLMSSAHFNLSMELAAKARHCPRSAHQLYYLIAQSPEPKIPDMSLLTHMAATEVKRPEDIDIDMKCIHDIACVNAQARPNEEADGQESSVCRLWLLYSFLNHSCVPNCEQYDIQDFKFVSAARDIACGEELTTSYVYLLGTPMARGDALERFLCHCERCAFERCLLKSIPEVAKLYADFREAFECESSPPARLLVEQSKGFSNLVESLLQNDVCARLTPLEKNWIKCSFGDAYLASYEVEDNTRSSPLLPFAAALMSVSPNTALVTLGKEMVKRAVRNLGLPDDDSPKEDLASELLQMSEQVYLPVQTKSLETIVNWCHMR